MYLRFEGLNTADQDTVNAALFTPVVVEIFRFSVDPLKELDLINDAITKITIEGAMLVDPTKVASSLGGLQGSGSYLPLAQSVFFSVKTLY